MMYTDVEIIKAMECCANIGNCAQYCPLDNLGGTDKCIHTLMFNALDLIQRLQEQNKALIAGQETLQKHIAEKDEEIERLEDIVDHLVEMGDA